MEGSRGDGPLEEAPFFAKQTFCLVAIWLATGAVDE